MTLFPFTKKIEVSRIRTTESGEKVPSKEQVSMDQLVIDLLMEQGKLLNQILLALGGKEKDGGE